MECSTAARNKRVCVSFCVIFENFLHFLCDFCYNKTTSYAHNVTMQYIISEEIFLKEVTHLGFKSCE
jgi:hypothetical protein